MKLRNTDPGIAFAEHIKQEKIHRWKHFEHKDEGIIRFFIPAFLTVVFVVLLVRLFFIQIIKGDYYSELSDANRTRTSVIFAPRGIIFDRHKIPLVFNVPGFRYTKSGQEKSLDRKSALALLAKGDRYVAIDSLRQYPYKDAMAHVLGYVGPLSSEEASDPLFGTYPPGSWVGKTGIERQYEKLLRGIDGKKLVEVDAQGRSVRVLGQTDPISGQDIILTLDSKLQQAVYRAMSEVKRGAAVVTTPTGEVLALVSLPSFDPNLFTLGEQNKDPAGLYKDVISLLSDVKNQPLLNRAISGTYPPGSTFKLITAAAGLEEGKIDERYEVEDTGILHIGAFSFANWFFTQYGGKDGRVNVVKGLARSNDIFFYKLAERVGAQSLAQEAKVFGVGNKTGIDLPGEEEGLVPSPGWKRKYIGEDWYLGDTYHFGIGQGYLLVTPLQVNVWTQVIANGGALYTPHLLKNEKIKSKKKFLSDKTISLIREGMVQSCRPGGVAWPFFDFRIKNPDLRIDGKNFLEDPNATSSASARDYRRITVACKTGTAQHGGEETKPHAWITLFAPAYNPQIVVTVLSEESGEGSNVAAPIAKKILEAWFGKQ